MTVDEGPWGNGFLFWFLYFLILRDGPGSVPLLAVVAKLCLDCKCAGQLHDEMGFWHKHGCR
jgi:hypothetical protein